MKIFVAHLSSSQEMSDHDVLSPLEVERVSRYSERDQRLLMRDAYLQRRAILSSQLGIMPSLIEFDYKMGKPSVRGTNGFHFSTSYSDQKMILACSQEPVGADLEKIEYLAEDALVANELYSPLEIEELSAADKRSRHRNYFAIWTQKEAFAKGVGEGFGFEFSEFSVALDGGQVLSGAMEKESLTWFTQPHGIKGDYMLAFATTTQTPDFQILHWNG